MMSFRGVPLAAVVAAGYMVGCAGLNDGDATAGEAQASAAPSMREIGCEASVCGDSNSPEIDHRGVHDLDMTRTLHNDEGFRITGFIKNNIDYNVSVYKATLTGLDRRTGAVVLEGGDPANPNNLIGAELRVTNDLTATEYGIRIDGVGSAPYWARPGGHQQRTPTYLVNWTVLRAGRPSTEWKNICSTPPGDDHDTMGMNRFHLVLFETTRISARYKAVTGLDKRWMSLGCASHAVSKLHLAGMTQGATNAFPALFNATLKEGTAFLKAMAADYCGNGLAHTVAGEPLFWKDHRGWMDYAGQISTFEARWTDAGAICMKVPRIEANQTQPGLAEFPDVWLAIKASCAPRQPPPECTGTATDFMGSFLLTGMP